jgi:hypothetical protein
MQQGEAEDVRVADQRDRLAAMFSREMRDGGDDAPLCGVRMFTARNRGAGSRAVECMPSWIGVEFVERLAGPGTEVDLVQRVAGPHARLLMSGDRVRGGACAFERAGIDRRETTRSSECASQLLCLDNPKAAKGYP